MDLHIDMCIDMCIGMRHRPNRAADSLNVRERSGFGLLRKRPTIDDLRILLTSCSTNGRQKNQCFDHQGIPRT